MSLQKESAEQFTDFFDHLYKMLRGYLKGASESPAKPSPAISGKKTATVPLRPQTLRSRRLLTTKELERYYAKPGEAQWGC
jgi:hypothetical protein